MTRKEATRYFKRHIDLYCVTGICREAEEMAIKALEQEPCEDAISRQAALEALEQEEPLVWCDGADEIAAHNQWSSDVDTVKNMPSVQPKPKTGHWIKMSVGYGCSECTLATNDYGKNMYRYCPNCFTKMESEGQGMSNTDVIIEVLLKFTEPYLAIGETNHDKEAYNNLLAICDIHDYCYDLIRENAELKGNEYSIVKAREIAIRHISESIVYMKDLLDDLMLESEM